MNHVLVISRRCLDCTAICNGTDCMATHPADTSAYDGNVQPQDILFEHRLEKKR